MGGTTGDHTRHACNRAHVQQARTSEVNKYKPSSQDAVLLEHKRMTTCISLWRRCSPDAFKAKDEQANHYCCRSLQLLVWCYRLVACSS